LDVGTLASLATAVSPALEVPSDGGTGTALDISGPVLGDVLDTAISGCLFTGVAVAVAAAISKLELVDIDETVSEFLFNVILGTEFVTVFGVVPGLDPVLDMGFRDALDPWRDVVFVPNSGLSFDTALDDILPGAFGLGTVIGVEFTEVVRDSGPDFGDGCSFTVVAVAAAISERELIEVLVAAGSRFLFTVTLGTGFFTGFGVFLGSNPVFDTGFKAAADPRREVGFAPEFDLPFDIALEDMLPGAFDLDSGSRAGWTLEDVSDLSGGRVPVGLELGSAVAFGG
jgi:hypothetical protein